MGDEVLLGSATQFFSAAQRERCSSIPRLRSSSQIVTGRAAIGCCHQITYVKSLNPNQAMAMLTQSFGMQLEPDLESFNAFRKYA